MIPVEQLNVVSTSVDRDDLRGKASLSLIERAVEKLESVYREEIQVAADLLRKGSSSIAAPKIVDMGSLVRGRPAEPVFLYGYKPRREAVGEGWMEAAAEGRATDHSVAGPEAPLYAQPGAQFARSDEGGEATSDIPIEAQRDALPQPTREYYEVLKAGLWARYAEVPMKVVLFVAATPGSGASTAAASFASLLAEDADTKVLFVDADLRSVERSRFPGTNSTEEDDSSVSLMQLLTGGASSIYPVPGPTNLYVLPSGAKCSMPLSLFQSQAFDEFLRTARERFQYVVVDAPSLQGCPESLVLSRKADGVIFVIESEQTRKRTAIWAKQQIEDSGGKLLGVVLNKRKYRIPSWLYKRISGLC